MATPEDELDDESDNEGDDCDASPKGDLKHITLRGVAKALWKHITCEEFTGANGEPYVATFTGKAAVECMLSLKFAPNADTAIDYLNRIEAPFARINGDADDDFFAEDFVSGNDDDPISPDSVMIGVRHSYGGFQRLMKQNRRAQGQSTVTGTSKAELMRTNSVISSKATRHFASDTAGTSMAVGAATETPTKAEMNPFPTRSLHSVQNPNVSGARKSALSAPARAHWNPLIVMNPTISN